MSNRQCNRVLDAIGRKPWAITPDGLDLVMGIAQRHISDKEAVLATPTERRESGRVQVRDGVAVLSVMGPIFPRADIFTEISGATSVESLALRFGEAVAAADVKAIVLHVDSPGGQITGIHEFASQIYDAREAKPVVAYVSGYGASAAYWLASAASKIVADDTAVLGSLGVVSAWTSDKAAREAEGLKDFEVVSSQSPNKRLDPAKGEGRAALQRELDALCDIFIADVARNRGKRVSTVAETFGQGGVMLASEAVDVGMADATGSLEDVITALAHGGGAQVAGGLNMAKNLTPVIGAADNPEDDDKNKDDKAKKAKKADDNKDEKDNGASDNQDDEEDNKGGKKARQSSDDNPDDEEQAKAAFMAKNPRLYKAILREGVMQERERIQAIEEMAFAGSAAMIAEAKFDKPCSPEALAVRLVKSEGKARRSFGANYAADAAEAAGVPASGAAIDGNPDEANLAAGIARGMASAGNGHTLRVVK